MQLRQQHVWAFALELGCSDALLYYAGARCKRCATVLSTAAANILRFAVRKRTSKTIHELAWAITNTHASSSHVRIVRYPDVWWPDAGPSRRTQAPARVTRGGLNAGHLSAAEGTGKPGKSLVQSRLTNSFDTLSKRCWLATQHSGYDVPGERDTEARIAQRIRGARWVTWLGPALAKKVGGEQTLRAKFSNDTTTQKLERGVMIRAGAYPELGHVSKKIGTPLLDEVAKVLKPITFFGAASAMYALAFGNANVVKQWERRFLDGAETLTAPGSVVDTLLKKYAGY